MKNAQSHFLALAAGLCLLLPSLSFGIIDANSNSLSDLWEKSFNANQLFPATANFLPLADPDKDGWTNEQEAEAGTDPKNANPPDGIVQTEIEYVPEITTYDPVTDTITTTPKAQIVTWPTLVGKQYQLLYSPDLSSGSWLPVGPPIRGDGMSIPLVVNCTDQYGTHHEKLFWRLAINDIDSDGDSLTDYEEHQLGTDPNSIDTDLDGIPDYLDPLPLTSATLANPDGTGLLTAQNTPRTLTTGMIGRWDLENHQILTTWPVGHTAFSYPDSSGNNHHATAFSVFPHPEGMISKAAHHLGGFVSIPPAILTNRKIYTTAFWARLDSGSIAAANGAAVGLFSHHQRTPVFTNDIPNWGLYRDQLNGLWFEKSGNQELLRAGTYTFINHNTNGQIAPGVTTNTGLSILRPSGTADDGKWHHYTLIRNDAITILYIDGILIGQATAATANIPTNTNAAISLGRIKGPAPTATNSTGRHGTSPTRGRFDRLRLWSRVLTPAEAMELYREDADHDGLIDVIENDTRFWRDRNANYSIDLGEQSYKSSPFIWQSPSTDSDKDGLSNIQEQEIGTDPYNPDTDGDRMPDGWEYENSLTPISLRTTNSSSSSPSPNPLVPDPHLDPDNDGISNLDEYRNNTKPNEGDSDADGKSDAVEIAQNSDPNNSSDQGLAPAPDEKISILLGIGDESGSHSEDYVLNCYRIDPESGQEIRVYTHVSGGFGQYSEVTKSLFKKGVSYTFQIDWKATNLRVKPATTGNPAEGPDFDYTFKVEPQGSLAGGILIPSYDFQAKQVSPTTLLGVGSDVATTEEEFKEKYESLRVVLLGMEKAPDKLASNGDFNEGDTGAASAQTTGAKADNLNQTLIAARGSADGSINVGDVVTEDLHAGWFGLQPGAMPVKFFDGATITITKLNQTDPATNEREEGTVRFFATWGENQTTVIDHNDPFIDSMFPNGSAPKNLVGKVYGTNKTIPAGAKFWIEGVSLGKITLEWRYQKGDTDIRHEQTFEIGNDWSKEKWQKAVRDEIYLDSFTSSSGSAMNGSATQGVNIDQYVVANDFLPNRPYIYSVYEYYAKLHREEPGKFLWAGLAKQAGAPVYAGLSDAQNGRTGIAIATFGIIDSATLRTIQDILIQANIDIYNDLSYQFVAYRTGGINSIEYLAQNQGIEADSLAAWQNIDEGNDVSGGNQDLLEREQGIILEQTYIDLDDLADGKVSWMFSLLATNPVPLGPDFQDVVPIGNIAIFDDRWQWITNAGNGMWPLWLSKSETQRLQFSNRVLKSYADTFNLLAPLR